MDPDYEKAQKNYRFEYKDKVNDYSRVAKPPKSGGLLKFVHTRFFDGKMIFGFCWITIFAMHNL